MRVLQELGDLPWIKAQSLGGLGEELVGVLGGGAVQEPGEGDGLGP
ncbi:MAG: hypothetical protein JWN00_5774 [Actinomycetia bacterium]|nr:hypothetical protein [Actinomycetes bacterium]